MQYRSAAERGHTRIDWLDSRHSFSFGSYHDPAHMGIGPLRVINDDRVAPGGGFGTHPHRDMEIISWVVDGALEHRDSLGNGSIIRPGDAQLMRAGTGISHSEFNPSDSDPVRFLQIWILPQQAGLEPGYQQAHLPPGDTPGRPRLLASPDGRDASLTIAQAAELWAVELAAGDALDWPVPDGPRQLWLQVVGGAMRVGEQELAEGDGLALPACADLSLACRQEGQVLIFCL